MQPFRIIEGKLDPDGCELHVEGELDMAVADQLQSALDRAKECRGVVIGLERCDFIDSTGIAVIVRGQSRMRADGGGLAAYGARGGVLRVLEMTGLTKDGLIFETAEEARTVALGKAA